MKKDPTVRKYGLIIGLVASLIMLVGILLPEYQYIASLNYIIIPLGLIFCCVEYGREKQGEATFGQIFQAGFFAGLLVLVILIVATVIFNMIFPEMKDTAIMNVEKIYTEQNIPEEQVDMVLDIMNKHWYAMVIASTILLGLIGSVISALIGAAVAPKKPNY